MTASINQSINYNYLCSALRRERIRDAVAYRKSLVQLHSRDGWASIQLVFQNDTDFCVYYLLKCTSNTRYHVQMCDQFVRLTLCDYRDEYFDFPCKFHCPSQRHQFANFDSEQTEFLASKFLTLVARWRYRHSFLCTIHLVVFIFRQSAFGDVWYWPLKISPS